jgi:xanthine/CO dehydrogenase XdhC/CoxF family maturation factor/YHS domain-containing protein
LEGETTSDPDHRLLVTLHPDGRLEEMEILITGMGRDNAERKLHSALKRAPYQLVLSCGFAGGLNPYLTVGTVVFSSDEDAGLTPALLAAGACPVSFHSADRVATTVAEKQALWKETGADAVEMESQIIRAICRAHEIPSATIRVISDAAHEDLGRLSLGPSASVVVGTHGSGDEEALEQILRGGAGLVSLIASRKRAAAVTRTLAERGVADDRIRRLRAPAGLDIGATTPAEIAVSILAEVIQHRRSDATAAAVRREELERDAMREETDPVCGMLVDVGSARYRSETSQGITYFCCLGCKEAFDREPQRFAASRPGARAERL